MIVKQKTYHDDNCNDDDDDSSSTVTTTTAATTAAAPATSNTSTTATTTDKVRHDSRYLLDNLLECRFLQYTINETIRNFKKYHKWDNKKFKKYIN